MSVILDDVVKLKDIVVMYVCIFNVCFRKTNMTKFKRVNVVQLDNSHHCKIYITYAKRLTLDVHIFLITETYKEIHTNLGP